MEEKKRERERGPERGREERKERKSPRRDRGDFYDGALNSISGCDNEKFYFRTFNASPHCNS